MISLLNFGDSPFRFLFFLVIGIFCVVIVVNLFAYLLACVIEAKTQRVLTKK